MDDEHHQGEMLRLIVSLWTFIVISITATVGLARALPRNGEVAYTRYEMDGVFTRSEIRLIDMDRGLDAVAAPPIWEASVPTWSPDGNQITFVSRVVEASPHLYIMNGDGRNVTSVDMTFAAYGNSGWLPDGQHLIYQSRQYGDLKPALFDLNSGQSVFLNVTGISDSPVSWSPNGKWIVYVSYQQASNPYLFMVNPACNPEPESCRYNQQVLSDVGFIPWPPSWSPDGKQLIFTGVKRGHTALYRIRVSCVAAPTDCLSSLTLATHDSQADDFAPSWSPDGQWIAFLSEQNGSSRIDLMNSQTGEVQPLTSAQFKSDTLVWSPDSRQILLASSHDDRSDLYLVRVPGGEIRQLTDKGVKNADPQWRPG